MSEAENNAQGDIWEEVYVGYSNGKENSLVLKKYPEGFGPTRTEKLTQLMLFFGVLVLVAITFPFPFQMSDKFAFYHGSFFVFFLVSLGNTWGQSIIVGRSPGYIKFVRWTTGGLWLYIIGFGFHMKHSSALLIPCAGIGMAILAFFVGYFHWGRYKREIQNWKETPEKNGLPPSREYIPYRFLIFEEGNNARLFEYRGNISKPGLVYKFPYEKKQASIKDELELTTKVT